MLVRGSASAAAESADSGPARCQSTIARLPLDDRDPAPARVRGGVCEREADAEAADEHVRDARPVVEGVERRVDEQPLRAAVGGVHQEAAVGDDLEQLPVPPQDDLAVGALATVQDTGVSYEVGIGPYLAGTRTKAS